MAEPPTFPLGQDFLLREILRSQLIRITGVATTCQGVVKSYGGLVACRFFLGVFEAGVFPGILLPSIAVCWV